MPSMQQAESEAKKKKADEAREIRKKTALLEKKEKTKGERT